MLKAFVRFALFVIVIQIIAYYMAGLIALYLPLGALFRSGRLVSQEPHHVSLG